MRDSVKSRCSLVLIGLVMLGDDSVPGLVCGRMFGDAPRYNRGQAAKSRGTRFRSAEHVAIDTRS